MNHKNRLHPWRLLNHNNPSQKQPDPIMNLPPIFFELTKATNEARAATGDSTISTRAGKKGLIQIVSVTFNAKGVSTVVPLFEEWMSQPEALDTLRQIAVGCKT